MKKLYVSLILIFAILFGLLFNPSKVNAVENIENEKNYSRAYKEYLQLSDEEKAKFEAIPRKYNVPFDVLYESENNNTLVSKILKIKQYITGGQGNDEEQIPSSFNLRNEIDIPVKDQGEYGLCWAFTSLRCLETNLALHGYGNYDFSEMHIAYIEKNGFKNTINENSRGTFEEFTDYLVNNYGPVLEKDAPYRLYKEDEYDDIFNLDSKAFIIEKNISFPTIDKVEKNYSAEELTLFRNAVKKHIMKNGSIYASISAFHINSEGPNECYLYNTTSISNHAVSIIGWDDNFPKEKFSDENGNHPKNNGAYIAVNSFGGNKNEGVNKDDLIYISYEDYTVEEAMSGVVSATTKKEEAVKSVKFEDENLYNAMLEIMGNSVIARDNNKLEIQYINNITCIEFLDLSNKNITNLKGIEVFEGVWQLNLSNNNINSLEYVSKLKNLQELNISENDLSSLDGIEKLVNLQMLDISDNKITDVSKINLLNKIICLRLSKNPIKGGIAQLTNINIEEIYLDNCNLDNSIVKILKKLTNLGIISLRDNNITDASGLIESEELYNLDLSGNMNVNLSDLSYFRGALTLQNCNISDLSIFKSFQCTALDLASNPISDIGPLRNLTQLSYLDLSGTNIHDVSPLKDLDLSVLFLSNNKNLSGLETLTKVETIKLNNCGIEDISFVEGLDKLNDIELSGNKIKNIEPILKAKSLNNIVLSNNEIESIPKISNFFQGKKYINLLDLSNNKIEDISEFENVQTQFYEINLSNNKIQKGIDKVNYSNIETINLKNQHLDESINLINNKQNIITIPKLLKSIYENRYIDGYYKKPIFTTQNCTIDFENNKIIINPKKLGEGTASITVKNGSFDNIAYTINYTSKESLELKELVISKLPNKVSYNAGENFDETGMIVEEVYENGIRIETKDYTVVNGQNLQKGQNNISIKSKKNQNLQANINIKVYSANEIITKRFPDNNLYKIIKNTDLFSKLDVTEEGINKYDNILDYDDSTNTLVLDKQKVERIKEINLAGSNIEDITGLEIFTNLEEIILRRNYKLNSISALNNLEKIKFIFIESTNITDIETLLRKNSVNLIGMELNETELITNQDTVTLPKFIYQSLTMQSGVSTEAYIYYDVEYNEEFGYNVKNSENKKSVEVKLDNNSKNAYIELDNDITKEKPAKLRKVEIIINDGKTDGSRYSFAYNVKGTSNLLVSFIGLQEIQEGELVYIGNINPATKISDIKQKVTTNGNMEIYKGKNKVSENEIAGTGYSLKISNGTETKEYIIIVKGDVSGNGTADFKDILKINKHRLNKQKLEGAYLKAGEVTGDGTINFKDILRVNKFRLGKIKEL